MSYSSDVILGDRYKDLNTGLEGIATSVSFYQHACERVVLDYVHDGDLKQASFDAPGLVHVETQTIPKVTKTGGPERGELTRARKTAAR